MFPATYSRTGIVLGLVSLLVAASIMAFTLHVLTRSAKASVAQSVASATSAAVDKVGRRMSFKNSRPKAAPPAEELSDDVTA